MSAPLQPPAVTGAGLGSSPVVASLNKTTQGEGITREEAAEAAARVHGVPVVPAAVPVAVLLPTTTTTAASSTVSPYAASTVGNPGPETSTFKSAVGDGGALTPGGITPGQELPGGWGHTKVAQPETSIYQDVSSALNQVGTAAYNAVPASLVDRFSAQTIHDPAAHPISTTTNTSAHEPISNPTTATGSIIPEGVRQSVANATASLPSAAEVRASIPSVADVKAAVLPASTTTTTATPATGPNTIGTSRAADGGIVGDLPTLQEVKDVAAEEAQYVQEVAVGLFDQAKTFLGFGGAATHAGTAPTYPENSETSPLAGGGGLAATIAPEVADAAKHSAATSVGDVPLTKTPHVHGIPDVASSIGQASHGTPLAVDREAAAVGGGAAVVAASVAAAAKDSPATSVGGTQLSDTPHISAPDAHPKVTGHEPLVSIGGPVQHPVGESTSSSVPKAPRDAAVGGGAAKIADTVASAAKDSHATSVGSSHLTSTPVVSSSADYTKTHGSEPLTSTGGPISSGTGISSSLGDLKLGAPIDQRSPQNVENLASTLKLPSDATPVSPSSATGTHGETPAASKALDSTPSKGVDSTHSTPPVVPSAAHTSSSATTPSSTSHSDNKTAATPAPISTSTSKDLPSTPAHKTTSHTQSTASDTPSSPMSPGGTHKKKPSFGDKLKGEFKVLSGKLGHDEQKVKEGEALKAGEQL